MNNTNGFSARQKLLRGMRSSATATAAVRVRRVGARARARNVCQANCESDGGARAGQHKFDQTDAFSGITNNPVQYSLLPFFRPLPTRDYLSTIAGVSLPPPSPLNPIRWNLYTNTAAPAYPIYTQAVLMMIIYAQNPKLSNNMFLLKDFRKIQITNPMENASHVRLQSLSYIPKMALPITQIKSRILFTSNSANIRTSLNIYCNVRITRLKIVFFVKNIKNKIHPKMDIFPLCFTK